VVITIPPRVLLCPMTCPMDPWIVHSRTVVLENLMGIIQIVIFGAKLILCYLLGFDIRIFKLLLSYNLICKGRASHDAFFLLCNPTDNLVEM